MRPEPPPGLILSLFTRHVFTELLVECVKDFSLLSVPQVSRLSPEAQGGDTSIAMPTDQVGADRPFATRKTWQLTLPWSFG